MRSVLVIVCLIASLYVPGAGNAASRDLAVFARGTADVLTPNLGRPLLPSPGLNDVYNDPAGDATGDAGDITQSTVTNTAGGVVTFDVDVANLPTLPPGHFYEVLVDVDANPATGDADAEGAETLIQLNGTSQTYGIGRWNGSTYASVTDGGTTVGWGSGPLIVVPRSVLGVTGTRFNFFEATAVVAAGTVTGFDFAPDLDTYAYTLTGLAPPPLPPPPPPPADTTPPNTRITSRPPNPSLARKATFRFTSTEARPRFRCKLDGRAWTSCSSPQTYRRLALGVHTFRVAARDAAGNVDPTPAAWRWRVKAR